MMPQDTARSSEYSIVALDKFIQATRDAGYKGTPSAISELVDNSIQAGAKRIAISVRTEPSKHEDDPMVVSVVDDGIGMDALTLRQALRFGGSTRFGDRKDLGRYGMGLPNASLSQARRVTVYTWRPCRVVRRSGTQRTRTDAPDLRVYMSYLDADSIMHGEMDQVPAPRPAKRVPSACTGRSGTLVVWTKCDRIDNKRVSTITRKIEIELARRFRHFLWNGLRITLNGKVITPFDPLYLNPDARVSGARAFGDEMKYEIRNDPTAPNAVGWVRVRFSELPVHRWHGLSNDEKRVAGISKGAGVSVVRAGREVDYGWFFMGSKHRENYDDWWRCEVQFDPVLDEAFGMTHTKQQIRPQAYLNEMIAPDIEATARALNSRARKAHLAVRNREQFSQAERAASERDHLLKPLPSRPDPGSRQLLKELRVLHPELGLRAGPRPSRYTIVEETVTDTCFYTYAYDGRQLILVLNPDHPFYTKIYAPLAGGGSPNERLLRTRVELLLLSAARSEAASGGRSSALSRVRLTWSNALAAFLNDG